MKNQRNIIHWGARLIAALILLQTLFFKFTAAPESVYIFTAVGMEPWGRIGIGILEAIAVVLLLINTTEWLGAMLGLGLMIGAIGMHLTILGIEVQDDGGYLFALALSVAIACTYILIRDYSKIVLMISKIRQRIS